ncbi:ethanol acetyltransferase 1 [Monosporozyma unispora]|nr:Alpha/beta hydrolase domain-containing protein 11 [Kazachstania unispora]
MTLPWRQVVDLSYNLIKSTNTNCTKPIILNLHGFLGSKNTFHVMNKVIKEQISTDIYTIDFRNHGKSPQSYPMTYEVMSNDLDHFIKNKIDPDMIKDRGINIIGFSMGAKVGLLNTVKSYNTHNIKKFVSIDMPPYVTPLYPTELTTSVELINEIDQGKIIIKPGSKRWREECLGMLGWYFGSGFLNVKENAKPNKTGHLKYYLPLHEFPSLLDDLKQWPVNLLPTKCSDTEVLFLRGLKSPMFSEDYSLLDEHFPNRKVVEFSAGHSLLFEQFDKASRVILDFLEDKDQTKPL